MNRIIALILTVLGLASAAQAQTTCTPGEQIRNQHGFLHIAFFAAAQNLASDSVADGKIVGDYAKELLVTIRQGKTERWSGAGTLRILIYTKGKELPDQLPYLGGDQVCRGMLTVEQFEGDVYRVRLPIEGGQWLAQASLVVPTSALATSARNAWVCVKPTFAIANDPAQTSGSFKGQQDILCGLPGATPGTTRLGEAAARGDKFVLFPLIAERTR